MTKVFITTIPLQGPKGLEKFLYESKGCFIERNVKTSFPIVPLINESAILDEPVKIICIRQSNEDTKRNYQAFIDELQTIGVGEEKVRSVVVEESQEKAIHIELLLSLLKEIEDESKIYACMTFGTKTIPVILMSLFNYVCKIKKHVAVEALVYGEIKRNNNEAISATLNDVTSLFYFNSVVDQVSSLGLDKPETLLEQLLQDTI